MVLACWVACHLLGCKEAVSTPTPNLGGLRLIPTEVLNSIYGSIYGTHTDPYLNPKPCWRLVADIFNDLALVIDLLSPTIPVLFMPLVCISSLCRSITGVAGGATRAACVRPTRVLDA